MLLITTFDIGGAERVYIELARGLIRRGYPVIAAALQSRSGRVAAELQGTGVTIVDLEMSAKVDLRVGWRLVRALRQRRVRVLYTFLIHSHVIGRIAARLAGTEVVMSSQQTMAWESGANEWLNRQTARWCSAIVGVSENVSRYLVNDVGLPLRRVVTIYNSVDVNRFLQDRQLDRHLGDVVGSVARLNPEKDHTTLLHAFRRLRENRPAARLILAGGGPELTRLQQLARSLGISDGVEFLGHVEDVRAVHARLAIYVQASHVEGMPVAVLEAMAAGLPIIATAVGGNEEAIVDGITGLLIPPRDPEALAAAMARLLADRDFARQLAEQGRRRVTDVFGTEAMVDATDRLIERLLAKREAAGVPTAAHEG